jgi:hypothetical protein
MIDSDMGESRRVVFLSLRHGEKWRYNNSKRRLVHVAARHDEQLERGRLTLLSDAANSRVVSTAALDILAAGLFQLLLWIWARVNGPSSCSSRCATSTPVLEVLVKAGCDVNQAAFRRVSTIFRRGAARGTRRADSRPPKRPLKEIRTLIYKSPGAAGSQPLTRPLLPAALAQLAR